jgi:hypothetical protein
MGKLDDWQADQVVDVLSFCSSKFRSSKLYKHITKLAKKFQPYETTSRSPRLSNFVEVYYTEAQQIYTQIKGVQPLFSCIFVFHLENVFSGEVTKLQNYILEQDTYQEGDNSTIFVQEECPYFKSNLSLKEGYYLHAGHAQGLGGPNDFQLQVGGHPGGQAGNMAGGGAGGAVDIAQQVRDKGVICDYICFRPFRQYTMGSGLLLKKGSELGNTFRGWADFQLTDNIIAKTHIGHFTFWHASVVTNPKCLFLAEDIFCTNYLSGEGKKILPFEKRHDFAADPIGTMTSNEASILVLPVPVGAILAESDQCTLQNVISLTGQPIDSPVTGTGHYDVGLGADYEQNMEVARESLQNSIDQAIDKRNQQNNAEGNQAQATAPRTNRLPFYQVTSSSPSQKAVDVIMSKFNNDYNFKAMNTENDYLMDEHYETSNAVINTITFRTMQKFNESMYESIYNPFTGTKNDTKWHISNLNCGHFGENGIYEGVKKIRCGYLSYFKEMDYQKQLIR